MGFGNRPYYGGGGMGAGGGGMGFALPRPTPAVKWIMILCGGMFLLQVIMKGTLKYYFGASATGWWQVWRYLTFQFLHSRDYFFHIIFNMLGLYFLGTPLEKHFGTKRFILFYLGCGIVAGLAYVGMSFLLMPSAAWDIPIIGASGGVYAIVLAAAILFPHFMIILLFFPVPIRLASILLFGVMILRVFMGLFGGAITPEFWSDVAHLGGAGAAGVYLWLWPKLHQARIDAGQQLRQGAWERKIRKQEQEDAQVDALLDKIQRDGIGSLSDRERKMLQDASEKRRNR